MSLHVLRVPTFIRPMHRAALPTSFMCIHCHACRILFGGMGYRREGTYLNDTYELRLSLPSSQSDYTGPSASAIATAAATSGGGHATWQCLSCNGQLPQPRTAHSALGIGANLLVLVLLLLMLMLTLMRMRIRMLMLLLTLLLLLLLLTLHCYWYCYCYCWCWCWRADIGAATIN